MCACVSRVCALGVCVCVLLMGLVCNGNNKKRSRTYKKAVRRCAQKKACPALARPYCASSPRRCMTASPMRRADANRPALSGCTRRHSSRRTAFVAVVSARPLCIRSASRFERPRPHECRAVQRDRPRLLRANGQHRAGALQPRLVRPQCQHGCVRAL